MKKLHGLFEVDLDPNKDDTLSTGSDCHLDSGGILIKLPLQLRASHFRIGFGNCGSWTFRNWVFEAYSENENMWHTLYNSGGVSPWADEFEQYRMGELKVFPADGSFGASQFRLRLTDESATTKGLLGTRTSLASACTSAASSSSARSCRPGASTKKYNVTT
jgi:hypothetical protein